MLLAALALLSFGSSRANAGYISSDGLAPFAEAGLLGAPSAAAGQADDYFANPDPTNPDGPTPSGLVGVFSRTPACPCRAPSGGRTPRSSSSGADGSLYRTATVLVEPQLIIPFRTASVVTPPSGPADSIFKPPRISV